MRVTLLRRRVVTLTAVLLIGMPGLSATATAAPAAGNVNFSRACDAVTQPRQAACLALVRTDIAPRKQATRSAQAPTGFGYGPSSLQSAYNLPSSSAGGGETVAIVDAFDDPNAESDLAAYRSAWGLPPCTTANGCFVKVNQDGRTSPLPAAAGNTGWAVETSLDLDMVSAACPNCNILLVEGNTPGVSDLGTAVNTAVRLGAMAVSNSYGTRQEYAGEADDDAAYYDHPGVAVTAAAGDSGFGVAFPAASPHVVAVGGTSLRESTDSRGWSETVWTGSGSGCSTEEPKPAWQTDDGCAGRTDNDVAAVADPATGVAVYDTYDQGGWLKVGGTSAAAPIIASVYALAGPPAAGSYPAENIYHRTSDLFDVTSGSDGTCDPAYLCTAGSGYDAPTGWGTPHGTAAFGDAHDGNIVNVVNPGDQTATQDVPFNLQLHASDSQPGQTFTFTATGLPPGTSIDEKTGLLSGTPTKLGTFSVNVTATDTTGVAGTAAFSIRVESPVSFTGTGPQSGYLGQPVLVAVPATDAVSGRTLTYSADGLPGGLSMDPSTGLITGFPNSSGYHRVSVTAHDDAGASRSVSFVWYVAPAQNSGRAGPIRLAGGHTCLAAKDGKAQLWACGHDQDQVWTVQPDGTIRALGECLTSDGTRVQTSACDGSGAQQWRIASNGELVSAASGKCLDDPASSTANGTVVDVWTCTGSTNERWTVPPGTIVSAVTGLCADSGAGTSGHVQNWYCGTVDSQAWTVEPDGSLQIAGRCLDVGADDAVDTAKCDRKSSQQWQIRPDGTLVNANGKCLTDPGDSSVAGTQLVVSPCKLTAGEIWHIE